MSDKPECLKSWLAISPRILIRDVIDNMAREDPSPLCWDWGIGYSEVFKIWARIPLSGSLLREIQMKLKKQLQVLVNEAPQYGVPRHVMEKAVIPVLKGFARQLKHPQYFLLTSAEGEWILTTIRHRENPDREKTVVYAFRTREQAAQFQGQSTSEVNTTAIPTTHLLWQLFSLKQVDSVIFMDKGDSALRGIEIPRQKIQASIEKQLQQLPTHRGKSAFA